MTEASTRFALPFILPGQAQKEQFHNEALLLLDGALHAAVEEGPLATPPLAPEAGQAWLVAADATGAWDGADDALALWTDAGWRFIPPVPGMLVWNLDLGHWHHWTTSGWSDGALPASAIMIGGDQIVGPRLPTISSPSGGTIIDAEARAAVDSVIVSLRTHGLID